MYDDGAVGQPPVAAPEVLFFENGATWYWLLAGPLSAAAMLTIQLKGGMGFQWFIPTVFLVLVTGFLTLQVKAARIHTSVELTRDYLRQGTETIKVASIVRVFAARLADVGTSCPPPNFPSLPAYAAPTVTLPPANADPSPIN